MSEPETVGGKRELFLMKKEKGVNEELPAERKGPLKKRDAVVFFSLETKKGGRKKRLSF